MADVKYHQPLNDQSNQFRLFNHFEFLRSMNRCGIQLRQLLLVAIALGFAFSARTCPATDGSLLPKTYECLQKNMPVTIVCLGDSVTGVYYHSGSRRAYPELVELGLHKQFPKTELHVINAGKSGGSTEDALARLQSDVLDHKPNLVTVMFGLNDMVSLPLEKYVENLTQLTEHIKASGAEVLICTPNSIEELSNRPPVKLAKYVARVRTVCKTKKLPLVDIHNVFEAIHRKSGSEFSLLLSDEIHPNMDGHKLIASQIIQAISGQKIRLADEAPPLSGIPHTLDLIAKQKTIKVLATPPYDSSVGHSIKKLQPDAKVEVSSWLVEGKTLEQIAIDAEKIRGTNPDLVVVAIPEMPSIGKITTFARLYGSALNFSLSYANHQWDVVALPPSFTQPKQSDESVRQNELVQQIINAHDLPFVVRQPNDIRPATDLFDEWFKQQYVAGRNK